MKNLKRLPSLFSIAFVIAAFNVIVVGQANDNQFAALSSSGASVRFDVAAPHAAVTLTVIGPDNFSYSKGCGSSVHAAPRGGASLPPEVFSQLFRPGARQFYLLGGVW